MQIVFWVVLALLLLFLMFLFAVMPRRRRPAARALACAVYAHRGLWGEGVAENSLSAFRRATEAGYGIELDVQLSLDGEVMVFHDSSLKRVTGCDASVFEKTAHELSSLRLSGTADTVPTLREVLSLVDGRVPLLIEIKPHRAWQEVCERTAAILDGYCGAYLVESFHPFAVAWFAKNRPQVVRGQLSAYFLGDKKTRTFGHFISQNMLLNFYTRPDFIAYCVHDRHRLPFLLCRLYRPYTFAWTIETKEDYAAAKGFDTVIFEGEAEKAVAAALQEGEKYDA
jgi:glycerophosphoryl diester phosphodiesterase